MTQAVSILTGPSPRAAAAALDANVIELWRLICVATSGAQFHEDGDATWFVTGSDAAPWLNQVLRLDVPSADAGRRIDALLASFAERGADAPYWCVPATARPADLPARLAQRGFAQRSDLPGMALNLDALPDAAVPAGVTIERVRDGDGLERWLRGYVDAFAMDERAARVLQTAYARQPLDDSAPLLHHVALRDGRPIASASVFLGGGVAGVWHVGVIESERRRGIGAALTLAPLREARDRGYRVSTLYASQMGESVYRRLGYRDCTRMLQYGKISA